MRAGTGAAAASGGRWRTPALVAGSLVVHLAVLGLLGLRAVRLDLPAVERVMLVELEPRPLLPGEALRVPRPTPAPSDPRQAARSEPSSSTADRREASETAPVAPVPRLAAPVPGAPATPADVDAWQVRPRTLGDRIGQALRTRTPGCAVRDALTAAEQAVCDERAAARTGPAITGTGDPARDARFAAEGARALARYEARRRPLSGGVGVVGPADCVGSNFGTGCAGAHLDPSLRPDATGPLRTRRDGPRASGAPLTPGAPSPRD
ncbi:hypothetical protein [Brevundimonas viscosa]|uniref:Uncharacterized protein n=1 Tax=Brevundimonas viscosa TaxID=871741 RepID=A0A1I6TMK2_9CAUL|nr:hypothetical protein [Brevundimonas viscosa]SFS90426.1 hypothetical protein SAMN05192570_0183 [Brevundimonas viscosa]